jgi:CheY-like chemotaxis protein
MGGDITVRSELNRGTTFTVEAPLAVAEAAALEDAPRQFVRVAAGQPDYRLLIVDDTLENRLLLSALLKSIGLEAREATNGAEAVAVWRAWRPHLIWMDIRMPVLDGYQATRQIRELEDPAAPCKIVALTASAFQHDRERILATGCDDFVTKPFRATTIYEKLGEHLGIEFVYDEPETTDAAPEPEAADAELSRERLLALPADLLASLKAAMSLGDIEAAHSTVDAVRGRDEPLARDLQRLIRAYRFDDVLDAIE